MGALILKDVFAAAQPLVIGAAIDSLSREFALVKGTAVRRTACRSFRRQGVFQYWMRVIIIGISRDIEFDLRNDLFERLVTLSWDFYGKYRTGDIMARSTNDLNAVRMMLGPGMMYWTETMLTMVLAVGVMAWVDWPLALVALAPAPVVSFVVMVFGRMIHTRFERIQKMFSDISSRVQENLAGVRVIRAYVQEEAEIERFELLNREYIGENIKLARAQGMFMPVLQALVGLGFLGVLWAGGARLLSGSISLGNFVMFNSYMGMLVWPMIALGWVVNLMERGSASLARIDEVMQQRPTIAEPEHPKSLSRARGEIEFRDVVVQFGEHDEPGRRESCGSRPEPRPQSSAIREAARRTLVNLIPRMIDATSGAVLLDGNDVREYSPADLRRADWFRSAGDVPVQSYARREHRAGCQGCYGGADSPRGRDRGAGDRSRELSRRLEDHGRRAGRHAVRRAEAANGDCACRPSQSANSHPGRRAVERGYDDGRANSYGATGRDEGPHDNPDLSSRLDGPACRSHLRHRVRARLRKRAPTRN